MAEQHIPQLARKGVPLEETHPYEEIRRAAEANREWDYTGEATKLYRRAEVVVGRLYPVIHTPNFHGQLPPTPIAIESLRNKNTLASYRLVPDGYGVNFRITFNEQHYIDGKDEEGEPVKVWRYGEWAQMETLVHELGHHYQQLLGKDPFRRQSKVTHNKEFTEKMRQLGIYCDSRGAHYQVADAEGPAGMLFREWGLTPPADVPRGEPDEFDWFKWFAEQRGRAKKARSTLRKYQCPDCGLNVRIGIKDDPELIHRPCGSVLVDATHGDVYKRG